MKLMNRWKSYMGPTDERIEAESNKIARVGYNIFLVGGAIALYYGIMLGQVACTTENPILTPLGERIFPSNQMLLIVYLIAVFVPTFMYMRRGITGERNRYAQIDHIPWDYAVIMGLLCAFVIGVLTSGMRIIAEIQIVGLEQVAWFGDLAMGLVFAGMGLVLGIVFIALSFKATIENRRKLEQELED